ncbi:hypothetical protein QJS04_geneDACA006570 [Acorus gramineus]|uniref:Uncharacterized protein n=1 Tax=Acorus gramineus TaxID=55184 RepID=A0AAV9AY54_ACOGR|nr:hypothetical protein QJS04_geneDACA006570 [Acorus gramineus]
MSSLVDMWTSQVAKLREKGRTMLSGGSGSGGSDPGSEPGTPREAPLGMAGLNQAMRAEPKAPPYSETAVSMLVECFSP